ncbi:MAG: beta-propeller domain-containing protein, partial [Acidimicrobiales bacterium]
MRKFIPTLIAIALLASSCSSNIDLSGSPIDEAPTPDSSALPSDDPVVTLDNIDLVARLFPFAQCAAFLDYVQGEAAERVGPYGLNNYGGYGGFPITERAFDQPADAAADEAQNAPAEEPASAPAVEASLDAGESATGGSDDTASNPTFSGTNVQEQGVDEPDIVKTDGNIIVTLSNNMFTVVDVSAGDPAILGSLRIDDGWISEFFLGGDKLIAVGEGNESFTSNDSVSISNTSSVDPTPQIQELDSDAGVPEPDFATEPAIVGDENYPVDGYWVQTAKVWTVDLSSAPRVEETLNIEGRYLSARAVDGNIRIVTTSSPNALPFLYPQNQSGEDRAEQANREIVAESVLADWLPNFERLSANGDVIASGPLTSCDQIHRPEAFAGFE